MTKTCDVSGVTSRDTNFYAKQSHLKAVDNLRRSTGATKQQMKNMFNQIANYR